MKYLLLFVTAALLLMLFLLGSRNPEPEAFDQAKFSIVLRKIGHLVLLQAGDLTSRVLPVKEVAENVYQLEFESQFTFVPDSLIKTIQQIVEAEQLPKNYLVEVRECHQQGVVFGYAIMGLQQKEIVPCTGRIQPKKCYVIQLQFQPSPTQNNFWYFGLGSLAVLGLGLLWYNRSSFKGEKETTPATTTELGAKLGLFQFNVETRQLILGDEITPLSVKEAHLLHIFTQNPGQLIPRSHLLKEVWEDEGVLISRSLDVYISRLRKKLVADPGVKLLNVPGQGYRLELGYDRREGRNIS